MPNRPKRGTPPPKVALTPENFDRLIKDHGTYVRVTPSIVCPRRSGSRVELDDTNHDLNCKLCYGTGAVDCDEISFETYSFIQSVKLEKTLDAQGIFDMKDAFASFPPEVRISYWYKIEILDFATQYNEVVMRGDDNSDILRYPAMDLEGDGNIFHVVDNDGNVFVKDQDYQLDSGSREIIWSKNAPVENKLYSILYPVTPTLRVLELMHETRNYYVDEKTPEKIPVNMPQQAHIRWDFMARKQGTDRARS